MKKVFIDTNVLLDYLMKRSGFFEDALAIIKLGCSDKRFTLFISSISFTNIAYVARKSFKGDALYDVLNFLREISKVAIVDTEVIDNAIASRANDFEDAVQYYSALKSGADCIVTRNTKDFQLAMIPVMNPHEFIQKYIL